MSKNKKHKEYVAPVTEVITEEIPVATEEMQVESVVLEPYTEKEENKPAVYTIAKAGTVTNCHRLNIRKEPNKDSEILKVIFKGDDVEIVDESTPDGWLSVVLSDGTKGYTMKDYIN